MEFSFFIFIFVLFFSFVWLVLLGVFGYHVFLYGLPSDATRMSFVVLIFITMAIFLIGVFHLSGFDWRGM